jgi:hypothetical protein
VTKRCKATFLLIDIRETKTGESMFTHSKFRNVVVAILLSLSLGATACNNDEFKARIGDFQQSVGLASSSIGTYFTEMNQFERDLYLQDVYLHPTKTVRPRWTQDRRTTEVKPGLSGPFNEDSIKARMDAITLLGRYGQRLAELAATNAPERFDTAAQALGGNLFNLQGTFETLATSGDPSARDFVSPIGVIVGAIGRMILEHKRDEKLRIAIVQAAPAVRIVINQLESDLNDIVVPQRLSGNSQSLQQLIVFYNCAADPASMPRGMCPSTPITLSLDQRRDVLNRINDAARRYELFKTNNPAEVIGKLRETHEALLAYAKNRSPGNLTALVASLDSFRASAQQIADAVVQIRNLKRGVA